MPLRLASGPVWLTLDKCELLVAETHRLSIGADVHPLVECFINKIKHYRRIFSRFEKLANRYFGFLSFIGALIWLR